MDSKAIFENDSSCLRQTVAVRTQRESSEKWPGFLHLSYQLAPLRKRKKVVVASQLWPGWLLLWIEAHILKASGLETLTSFVHVPRVQMHTDARSISQSIFDFKVYFTTLRFRFSRLERLHVLIEKVS